MKYTTLLTALLALSLTACNQRNAEDPNAGAPSSPAEALARKSNCMSCHAVHKKMIGPAFKEVAAKYKGDKDAQAKLEGKVRKGGSGSFGSLPMPAASNDVSDEDIRTIVQWVLSLE